MHPGRPRKTLEAFQEPHIVYIAKGVFNTSTLPSLPPPLSPPEEERDASAAAEGLVPEAETMPGRRRGRAETARDTKPRLPRPEGQPKGRVDVKRRAVLCGASREKQERWYDDRAPPDDGHWAIVR